MKTDIHSSFILHSRPYRESSLLLDVFSSQYGRVNLVANGVKRRKNNRALLLQPARKLNIAWQSKGDLGTLTSVEEFGDRYKLLGTRLISCFYMNELLVRLLHKHEAHPELFKIYEKSMEQLDKSFIEDQILRIFEKHLLISLGYGLILDHDAETGEKIVSDNDYFYQLDYGPVSKKNNNTKNIAISGSTLLALEHEKKWDKKISKEAKALLRMVLSSYTSHKPFGSRELYKAYLQNSMSL